MKRLLVIGDANRPTGFEKVVRGVASPLATSGQWDVVARGIGYDPEKKSPVAPYPFEVKPAWGGPEDPIGMTKVGEWIEEDKPDVIWVLQDLWNVLAYTLGKPPEVPMACYYPVDGPNVLWGNAVALSGIGGVATYTQFAARESAAAVQDAVDILRKNAGVNASLPSSGFGVMRWGNELEGRIDRLFRYQDPANYQVIPHGLTQGEFFPLPEAERLKLRKAYNIPESAFVVMNVGTNQFRKRLDLTMRAFAALRQHVPNAVLVLHCSGHRSGATDGYPLAQLAYLYGVQDHVRLIHETFGDLTTEQLCGLYNCADVHLNTSGGEGWGLCSVESAACGIPQVVPDWSATRELWKEHAKLIKVANYRIEPQTFVGVAHGVIDVEDCVKHLRHLATSEDARNIYGTKALELAARQWSWDRVSAAMERVILQAVNEGPAEVVRLVDAGKHRPERIRSEVASWLV